MIEYYYRFCGVVLRLRTDRPLWEDTQSARFRVPTSLPDVTLELDQQRELLPPEGAQVRGERCVYQAGDQLVRLTRDPFRSFFHLRTCYRAGDPARVSVEARTDCWQWASRSAFLWPGVALPQLLLYFRALVLHASYIGVDDRAVLFTAPSGTGKSTQAELWRVHRDAAVINGDKAGITLTGAPAAHGLPFAGTSGICENVSLPLRAVVVLRQAPENTVRRLGPAQAVAALSRNLFADQSVPEEWQLAVGLLLDLVSAVPVLELACTPDVGAVECLENAMKEIDG